MTVNSSQIGHPLLVHTDAFDMITLTEDMQVNVTWDLQPVWGGGGNRKVPNHGLSTSTYPKLPQKKGVIISYVQSSQDVSIIIKIYKVKSAYLKFRHVTSSVHLSNIWSLFAC